MTRRPLPTVLVWIIAFKAFKCLTLVAVGVVLLATRHADPADLLIRGALILHVPLTSRILDRALHMALSLTVAKQTGIALTAFGYGALMGAEGIALYLRKPWARWFTIIATASFIPVEIYEIAREPHLVRLGVLVVNAAIVVYLVRRKDIFE